MFGALRLGLGLSPTKGGGGGAAPVFDPVILFANGEQGIAFEPYDLSTLFQATDGTTPVTADGDLVGYLSDNSGNANHAVAAGATNRPRYKAGAGLAWLLSDAIDDALTTTLDANALFGAEYEMIIAGRFNSASASSATPWLNDAILSDSSQYISFYARSSGLIGVYQWDGAAKKIELPYTVGTDFVFNVRRSGGNLIASVNDGAETTLATGAMDGGATALRLFRQSTYTDARLYGAWATDRVWTADERAGMKTYAGSKAGLTL